MKQCEVESLNSGRLDWRTAVRAAALALRSRGLPAFGEVEQPPSAVHSISPCFFDPVRIRPGRAVSSPRDKHHGCTQVR